MPDGHQRDFHPSPRPEDMRTQAAAYVDAEHRRVHDDLFREHRRQEQRILAFHKGQLQGFERNREQAELRYLQKIKSLDEQQARAAAMLERQHRSIRGRFAGLTKAGRATQQERREAIAEDFDRQRMREHRNLEELKERQFEAEQADRISRAREIKFFRLDHLEDRQKQTRDHQASRELKIDARMQEMKRTAEQALRHELHQLNRQQQEQTRGRPPGG
jgi:hypothetical protein